MKRLYTYDLETDTYKPVKFSILKKTLLWVLMILCSVLTGIVFFQYYYSKYNSPKEAELVKQNKVLKERFNTLNDRLLSSYEVMNDITDRDIEFYRVLLQYDSVPMERIDFNMFKNDKAKSTDRLILDIEDGLDRLDQMLYLQSVTLDDIMAYVDTTDIDYEYLPAITPVPESSIDHIASGFGMRFHPILEIERMHEGIDFSADPGTPIYATGEGDVITAGEQNGYGKVVYIDHGHGYTTRYAHMSHISVAEGQHVKRGQVIGTIGNTGLSTGPHVHYEVRINDRAVNPVNYFFNGLTARDYNAIVLRAERANHPQD